MGLHGTTRDTPLPAFVALASLLVVQVSLAIMLLTPGGNGWGRDECQALRLTLIMIEQGPFSVWDHSFADGIISPLLLAGPVRALGPGPLALKVISLSLYALTLILIAATLYRHVSARSALIAATLIATTPALFRAPLVTMSIPVHETTLAMIACLYLSLNPRHGPSDPANTRLGLLAGLGLGLLRGFGLFMIALTFTQWREGSRGWWRPIVIALVVGLVVGQATAGAREDRYSWWRDLSISLPSTAISELPLASSLTTASSVTLILVVSTSLACILLPLEGAKGKVALTMSVAGALFGVVFFYMYPPQDVLLRMEDSALIWILLVPASAIVIEHVLGGTRRVILVVLSVAALGAWDLVQMPIEPWDNLPACRWSPSAGIGWSWSSQGSAICTKTTQPWEDCVRHRGRDVVWNERSPRVPTELSEPSANFFALGVGEGLAELLGPGRIGEVHEHCSSLGGWPADVCAGGVGSREAGRIWDERSVSQLPCDSLSGGTLAQCVQGLGAGILLETRLRNATLRDGLDVCALLPSVHESNCVRGFGQALMFARRGATDPDPYNFQHCEGMPEQHVLQCIGGRAGNFGWTGDLTLDAALETCVRPGIEAVSKFCLINFGAAAGFHHGRDLTKAFALCEGLPPELVGFCVEGVGDGLAWVLVTGQP